ncbi:protein of unknown function [Zhouia amylolytica]|uniref:DUF3857 domain-containing protein n=1 Tax=Zhouia amylolytica TaxID=376730 RepID=A0A1I6QXK5_9FLAO|nr:DUF3857 domain-containing protein [Zhouia amylolytica]MCQ0110824.1 DUF3857 domain-containing protein [Zhouia amylolytica]SFS57209.1 protein of unknown function [Zhouia amylolytica]
MKLRFFLFLIIIINNFCHSQKETSFGDIPPNLLEMKEYPKDSTASAVIIMEKGFSKIDKNRYDRVKLITEYLVRIKILNKKGLDKATIEIPLYKSQSSKSKEIFREVHAVVINPDRTTGSLNNNDVHLEDYNEYYDLLKFTVPNVQIGAVIDYRYVIESPFFFNFNSWNFQSDIPKVYSEYSTSIPANYKYNIMLKGPLKLSIHESDIKKDCFYFQGVGSADCILNTYVMKDIPAFKEEDYMISKYNYLSAIDYELESFEDFQGQVDRYTKSWKDTDKEFKSDIEIGSQAKKENYFEKLIPNEITKSNANGIDKAKQLYYWLQSELFWNNKNSLFSAIDVKDAFDQKSGSSTELNLILLNFLKAAGFDAEFMLLSTREHGLPTKLHPVISDFNYLVVKLNDNNKSYLLDITNKNMSFGMIPFKTLNGYGRVFDLKNNSYWYDIRITNPSEIKTTLSINIAKDNQITAKIRRIYKGYKALNRRNEIRNRSNEDISNEIQSELDNEGFYNITNYITRNEGALEKALIEEYDIQSTDELNYTKLLLNPFIIDRIKENPFNLNERLYPVDFGYPYYADYAVIINFPEQCLIENLPESKGLKLAEDKGYMIYKVSKKNNKIVINNNLRLEKSNYESYEYEGLKQLFAELVFLQNNQPLIFKLKPTK